MVAIDCDTDAAFNRIMDEPDAYAVTVRSRHELWRVYMNDCVAVAYNGKVLPQGVNQERIADIIARLPKQQGGLF